MLFSKSCEYAIRGVVYIAAKRTNSYVSIREVSEKLGISFHFLTKTLQVLTQRGLIVSNTGPHGGILLARPAEEIRLTEIIEAIDGVGLFKDCILGGLYCSEEHSCVLHGQWAPIRQLLWQLLHKTTMADLAKSFSLTATVASVSASQT